MLVGKENIITKELVQQISEHYPVSFVPYDSLEAYLNGNISIHPGVIFINLLDVDKADKLIVELRETFPNAKIFAIHYFEDQAVIDSILNKGFDNYLPMFSFGENLVKALDDVKT